MKHLEVFKKAITGIDGSVSIHTQKGPFTATPVYKEGYLVGVEVSNLRTYGFIPRDVFTTVISLLQLSVENTAENGNAMAGKLGDANLPLTSVEGHIARVVYGKEPGDSVFRRITPVSKILEWAGACEIGRSCLKLK